MFVNLLMQMKQKGLEQTRKKAIVEHTQAKIDKCKTARAVRLEKAAQVAG